MEEEKNHQQQEHELKHKEPEAGKNTQTNKLTRTI